MTIEKDIREIYRGVYKAAIRARSSSYTAEALMDVRNLLCGIPNLSKSDSDLLDKIGDEFENRFTKLQRWQEKLEARRSQGIITESGEVVRI